MIARGFLPIRATGFTTLLLLATIALVPARTFAQGCDITELCTGNLNVGLCGYSDAVCVPPPGGMGSCAKGGQGSCSGTYNCQPPMASQQGVQLFSAAGGSFTARLSVDVVAPFNSWATEHSPPGTLNIFWYNSPSVPDICDGSVQSSLCTLANAQSVNGHLGTDHGLTWLDKTGLTCAGAPYDFVVSALFSACQQPSCICGANQNCLCNAVTSTPLNNLEIKLPKAAFPGCVPPPEFCPEAGGAGGPGGGAGSSPGERMAGAGSKGNGPDSGAAGTQGNGQCQSCKPLGSSSNDGSGCGASVGGGGSSCLFKAAGAHFRYGAGGVGGPGWPGSTGVTVNPWNVTLGRYWSHDYAERIVMDPDESHVWLLTRFGSFREFGSLAAGSGLRLYQTVTPSDEYRRLYFNATTQGWQLQGLDGSVESFLPKTAGSPAGTLAGFLDRVTDRLYDSANPAVHPPVQAVYNAANQLDHVTFPDGRQETFAYAGGTTGKLASLTEVGTDGAAARTWTFVWSGDDLITIGRPDICAGLSIGTAWHFSYSDATHPGYLTQVLLTDCHNTSRVEAELQYDSFGNVVEAWRGDPLFTGPNATDAFQLSFDSPALPAVATVQTLIQRTVVGGVNQDVWQTGTYTLDRDPGRAGASGSRKVRVKQVTGECPSCGTVANPAFTFADPANPLLPTAITDGKGVTTSYSYDANGRQLTRIETVQTTPSLVQRQTSWTYDATFLSFVKTVTGPFSPPGAPPAGARSITLVYDPKGNVQTSTIAGSEATYPSGTFSLQTAFSAYSAAGLPGLIDPPDTPSTTTDATTYTFKSGVTNGYLVAIRKDPVVGAPPLNAATAFQYDALNRQTDVTDVNGTTTHTTYDPLNRVLTVTQGFGSSQPLTTTYGYSALGDLVCMQLPAGNALAYTYDAAGRLASVARQASCGAAQPIEQTLYALDAAGHRVQEVRQRIVNVSPVTDATTTYAYTTTCHLDSMTAGDPSNPSLQSTTQFAYDCNNNLTSVQDPNHNRPAPASTTYAFDPLNRLVRVTQPWGGSSGGNAVTIYAYDLQDHLTAVTDSERNQTTYITSDRDLLTRQTSPVSGITTYAYNAHGALVQQTDARGVITTRQLDPADRPTSVTYSNDPVLTTTYAYDTTTATGTAPIGRLSSITKGSNTAATVVNYTYDLFGRLLQDGALSYGYDPNGNRAAIAYPGSVTACYGYDLADRQASLSYSTAAGLNACQGATTPIVTSTPASPTVYSAAGPLQVLHLANGITETHTFDQRYYPAAITAGNLLTWTYSTDAAGNITAISPGRSFVYQDFQYFLTQANAPTLWGTRTWAYDTIGNRLSEDRGSGAKDTYAYFANSATPPGDTPLLKTIALANAAGTKYLGYDFAGNVIQEAAPTSQLDFTVDAAGKVSRMTEETQRTSSALAYDGRGFLSSARGAVTDCGPLVTTPTYSSDGLLFQRQQQALFSSALQAQTRVFYFAGRPVAQLDGPPVAGTLTYLTVDHLGTPILASSSAAVERWSGGFEPFGKDFTSPSAQNSGIFLRLPGQWDDAAWDNSRLSAGLYYNLNRWYAPSPAQYTQPDRQLHGEGRSLYTYVDDRPLTLIDQSGLAPATPQNGGPSSVPSRCTNCNPHENEINIAVTRVCQNIRSGDCQNVLRQYGLLHCFQQKCKTPLKVVCISSPGSCGGCGGPCNNLSDITNQIFLQNSAFSPICGSLADTVAHEMGHMCGIGADVGNSANLQIAIRVGQACGK